MERQSYLDLQRNSLRLTAAPTAGIEGEHRASQARIEYHNRDGRRREMLDQAGDEYLIRGVGRRWQLELGTRRTELEECFHSD